MLRVAAPIGEHTAWGTRRRQEDHMRSRNTEGPLQSDAADEPRGTLRPTRPRKVGIGYARVAALSQTAPKAALNVQAAMLLARARAEGIELIGIIEESGESAHNLKRPGLVELFRILDARRIRFVIIADLSRLARNLADLRRLLRRFARRRVALIVVEESLDTGTSEGRRELRALDRLSRWWR